MSSISLLRAGALVGALLFGGCRCASHPPTLVSNVDPVAISDTIRIGVIVGEALDVAEREWNSMDVYQNERAKCVGRYDVSHTKHSGFTFAIYSVSLLDSAKVTEATPDRLLYHCPTPRFHTHPPSVCQKPTPSRPNWYCERTTAYERNCQPSETDKNTLAKLQHPFAIVQCGRNVFTFHFPPPLSSLPANDSIPHQAIPRVPEIPQ